MRADQARNIPIPALLEREGHRPERVRASGRELWYRSPIRAAERTASFKVDMAKNLWYDHGAGRGGNAVDLIMELRQCSVRDALRIIERTGLSQASSYVPPASNPRPSAAKVAAQKEKQSSLELVQKGPLKHPALLQYLSQRGINSEVASHYASQIDFKAPGSGSSYFAVGYPAGDGFEARSALFKGFVGSTKNVTFHDYPEASRLLVFEGFMDFLTYLTVKGQSKHQDAVLVLNSGAMRTRALPFLEQERFAEIQLFMDNDEMGDVVTSYVFEHVDPLRLADMRRHYEGFDDLNAWHMQRKVMP